MRVWVDLSNSPHALLFEPLVDALRDRGHVVVLTARDNAQTAELARKNWPDIDVIGGESPRSRIGKARVLGRRVGDLVRWAQSRRPEVALSHNSYAQIVAARRTGVTAVTAMDYEYQPANHVAFRLARTVLLPEPMRALNVALQGATRGKVRFYPGLKEEIYLGAFEPDAEILERYGVQHRDGEVLVVARTPPSRALYHGSENPMFIEALRTLGTNSAVRLIVLARHAEQRSALESLGLPNLVVPKAALDARSLMYAADVVIGAGGTMTREAALLGLPTWTVFGGRVPAVDRWLERRGLLRRLNDPSQLRDVTPRPHAPRPPEQLRRRADELIPYVIAAATFEPGHLPAQVLSRQAHV